MTRLPFFCSSIQTWSLSVVINRPRLQPRVKRSRAVGCWSMCVSMHAVSKLHTISEERGFVGLSRVRSQSLAIHCSPLLHPETKRQKGSVCVCVCGWGALFVFPATEKVPGELGCVSNLMNYQRSAPRALSNSAAWESSRDSAVEKSQLCQPASVFLSMLAFFSPFFLFQVCFLSVQCK